MNTQTVDSIIPGDFRNALEVCDVEEFKDINNLLSNLLGMGFDKNNKMSFQPYLSFHDGSRSFNYVDIKLDEMSSLYDMMINIKNPVIKARIADALWSRKESSHFKKALNIAVENYLLVINKCVDDLYVDNILIQYVKRVMILDGINKNIHKRSILNELLTLILTLVNGFITDNYHRKNLIFPLIIILIENRYELEHLEKLTSDFFETDIKNVSTNTYIDRSLDLYLMVYKINHPDDDTKNIYKKAAEFYVELSEIDYMERKLYAYKSNWLSKALNIYKSHGIDKKRYDEVHKLLLDSQEKGANEHDFATSKTINVEDVVKSILDMFSDNKTFFDSIITLSSLPCLTENTLEQLIDSNEKSISEFLFPTIYPDEKGRILASDGKSEEENKKYRMVHSFCTFSVKFFVQSCILPGIKDINENFCIDDNIIAECVCRSNFVLPGDENFYIRGLKAGFEGDWILSTMFLVPQIESSFRHLLELKGITTSVFSPGSQKTKHSLEELVKEAFSNGIICETYQFVFEALLYHPVGFNLRHNVCHSLKEYNHYNSISSVYLWWFVLHIIVKV